ncbi:MAG: hypothetical protein P9M14_02520 [Candidatus Alcyoniella australis]|nr:hypothetical protein [Candidatus Alcyoniella australis]
MIYLECKRHRSQGLRPLSVCLTRCKRRCAAFEALPDSQVLEFIRSNPPREPYPGYQLRLFPCPAPETEPQQPDQA